MNDIKQEFSDKRIYPGAPLIVPISLNEAGTEFVKRDDIMDGPLKPSAAAEVLGGAMTIVAPAVSGFVTTGNPVVNAVAEKAVKAVVQTGVTTGLDSMEQ